MRSRSRVDETGSTAASAGHGGRMQGPRDRTGCKRSTRSRPPPRVRPAPAVRASGASCAARHAGPGRSAETSAARARAAAVARSCRSCSSDRCVRVRRSRSRTADRRIAGSASAQFEHRDAVRGRRQPARLLPRLAGRHEAQLVEAEVGERAARERQVAEVHRIEAAAEQADAARAIRPAVGCGHGCCVRGRSRVRAARRASRAAAGTRCRAGPPACPAAGASRSASAPAAASTSGCFRCARPTAGRTACRGRRRG